MLRWLVPQPLQRPARPHRRGVQVQVAPSQCQRLAPPQTKREQRQPEDAEGVGGRGQQPARLVRAHRNLLAGRLRRWGYQGCDVPCHELIVDRVGQGCAQHCVGAAHGPRGERGENHVLVALASRDDPALGPRAGALAAARRLLSVLQLRQPVPQRRSWSRAPLEARDELTRSILSVRMSSALLLAGLAAVPAATGVGVGPLDEPPPPVSSPGRVPKPMSTPAPQVNPDGELPSLRTEQSRTFQGAKLAGGQQLAEWVTPPDCMPGR